MKLKLYTATWCRPCKEFAPLVRNACLSRNIFYEEIDIDTLYSAPIKEVPSLIVESDNGNIEAICHKQPQQELNKFLDHWFS